MRAGKSLTANLTLATGQDTKARNSQDSTGFKDEVFCFTGHFSNSLPVQVEGTML
tara:strand:- start:615 stop:779 length:165 start_codon:yes stop_codon:yes gene_type:complete